MRTDSRLTFAACLLIGLSTLTLYWQIQGHAFISFDDYGYIVDNVRVHQGLNADNVVWAFSTLDMSNWHPLTWLSYMLDADLHGLRPSGILLGNILLHITSAVILFLILHNVTGSFSASLVVAMLFALHPTRAESVAWASERKDVLSVFFIMLSLRAYIEYANTGSRRMYLACALLFALGLMSKPMLVSLPLLLLLLDHWPLGRFRAPGSLRKLLIEKIPLAIISAASSIITYYAQMTGQSIMDFQSLPLLERLLNVFNSYMAYVKMLFLPVDLAVFYPFPDTISPMKALLSIAAFAVISTVVVKMRQSRPYLAVGWGFFVISLLPVIGIVQVGIQSMADRYTYWPYIGLFIIVAFGSRDILNRLKVGPKAYAALWSALLIIAAILSWNQIGHWRDSITLYSHTVNVTTGNYSIHNKLGMALFLKDRHEEAINQFGIAKSIKPDFFPAVLNLANALNRTGQYEKALEQHTKALMLRPGSAIALYGIGQNLVHLDMPEKALALYSKTTGNSPDSVGAGLYMGDIMQRTGHHAEAIAYYGKSIELEPGNSIVYFKSAISHASLGEYEQASTLLAKALALRPGYPEARTLLDSIAREQEKQN